MNKNHDACYGCFIHDGHKCTNRLPPEKNGWVCPCLNCIVKPMCTDVCDEIRRYYYYIRNQEYYEHTN